MKPCRLYYMKKKYMKTCCFYVFVPTFTPPPPPPPPTSPHYITTVKSLFHNPGNSQPPPPPPSLYEALVHVITFSSFCSDHAKLLWKRIPKAVKQSNGEIGELWEIGKRLWRRDFAAVYEPAQNPAWPPHIAPLVASLVGEQVPLLDPLPL